MYKDKELVREYCELLVKIGANVQKGQEVVVQASTEDPEFVTILVEECYKVGAKNVEVIWENDELEILNYKYKDLEELSHLKDYQKAKWEYYLKNLPVRIYIESSAPDALNGIDNNKRSEAGRTLRKEIRQYRDLMDDKYQWLIAAIPSKKWAKEVFPNLNEEDAYSALWEAILKVSRVEKNKSIDNWNAHDKTLTKKSELLNSLKLLYSFI